jgi:two-component system response regulator RegX3
VKRIRAKIEEEPAEPRLLLTVRGLGYRFEDLAAEV